MTTNRLARSESPQAGATSGMTAEQRQAHWIARGNRVLWGQEPTTKGEMLEPRYDLEWRCANGSYFLASRAT